MGKGGGKGGSYLITYTPLFTVSPPGTSEKTLLAHVWRGLSVLTKTGGIFGISTHYKNIPRGKSQFIAVTAFWGLKIFFCVFPQFSIPIFLRPENFAAPYLKIFRDTQTKGPTKQKHTHPPAADWPMNFTLVGMSLSLAKQPHLAIFEVIPSPSFSKLFQLRYFLSPDVNFDVRETLANQLLGCAPVVGLIKGGIVVCVLCSAVLWGVQLRLPTGQCFNQGAELTFLTI